MLTDTHISALRAPFPAEALSADTSRGFELTSIKAAYVVERLNQVFGPCGCGWRYVHSPFEMIEGEVLTEVALQFKVVEGGINPVTWNAESRDWVFVVDGEAWSWPIFSPGGRRPGKGTAPITDARKGAITDGLTKAASMIGVGHEVFKGLVRVGQASAPSHPRTPQKAPERAQKPAKGSGREQAAQAPQKPSKPSQDASGNGKGDKGPAPGGNSASGNGANATTFWRLANGAGKVVDRATVSDIAKTAAKGDITWNEAQDILQGLIADAQGDGQKDEPVAPVKPPVDPLDELFG